MFGKSTWFHENSRLAVPAPASRQGWRYYGIWLGAIALPTALLIVRGQIFPEALIWMAVSAGVFLFDVRRVRAELIQKSALARMHFIGDETPEAVETPNWRLEIKR